MKNRKDILKSRLSIKLDSPPHALNITKHDNYNNLYLIVSYASMPKIKSIDGDQKIEDYKSFLFINYKEKLTLLHFQHLAVKRVSFKLDIEISLESKKIIK